MKKKTNDFATEAKYFEENFDEAMNSAKKIAVEVADSVENVYLHLDQSLNIRFDGATLKRVRVMAKQKGLKPTQLIRMWTAEGLERASV